MTETTNWLHTPAETSSAYVKWAERLQTSRGITYGCVLDKVMVPLHPGDLMAVVARPGHGKSSFAAYLARRTAMDIRARGADDEVVLYVSWEQPVEEIEAFFQSGNQYSSTDLAWGRVDLEDVKRSAAQRPLLPIWLIGNSVMKPDPHRPPLYADIVWNEIRYLEEKWGKRPTLVVLDYIQKIPSREGGERIQQVTDATYAMKDLAMSVGVPVVACVQASRAADDRKDPIPAMRDCQWSSAIEQEADKQIAVFRPIKHYDPAETPAMTINRHDYDVTPELFVVRLLKQRLERGYGTFPIRFEPQTLTVGDYDITRMEDVINGA